MATAQTLIDRSLRLIGAVASGESPTTTESDNALITLNGLVSAWLSNKDMTVTTLIAYASLSTSQSLGDGYENALVYNLAQILAPEYEKPPNPEIDKLAADFLAKIRRDAASSIVAGTGTNIITKALRLAGALGLSEAPTTKELEYGLSTLNGMIGTWLANRDMGIVTLIAYASAATVQSLPSGYENALVYNLAVELAAQYGKPASPDVLSTAATSLKAIRRAAAPAVGTTVQKILNRALRLIGQIGPDEISTSTESAYALDSLNAMLDSWSIDRMAVYAKVDTAFTVTATDNSYTVGPAGNFALTPRPTTLDDVFIRVSNIDYPVEMVSEERWFAIPDKTTTSAIPNIGYYEPSMTTGTLLLWPVPSAASSLHIVTWQTVASFSTVSTSISLPPGYERAIVYNLALEIAGEYSKKVSDVVFKIASDSKAAILRANQRSMIAYTGLGALLRGGARSDIYSGGQA